MVSWPKNSCAWANGWSLLLWFEDLLYASGPENEWQKCIHLHITDPVLLNLSKINISPLVCLFIYGKSLIFLCKRTCKWVTSMLHKSPTWTPGRNATIHMEPLIKVVEGHSKWKYICMTLFWHLALELVGMRKWFPKNGDSPESQDEINLWVKSAADLWCCSNISKYEQISWKCSSLEEKTLWTYSHDIICWDKKHQEISSLTIRKDITFGSFF